LKNFIKNITGNSLKKIFENTVGIEYLIYLNYVFPSTEEKTIKSKRLSFYQQFLNQGSIYFDIGANFGNRIEPLIHENFNIVAVEPQAECVKLLKLRYGKKITIIPKGLGEKEEIKEMHIADNSVLSSFSTDWIKTTQESGRFKKYNWNNTRKIEITTLDRVIAEHGKPNFAKIDVEGYELHVLNGLTQPIEMISLEYAAPEGINLIEKCLIRLENIATNSIECNYSVGESMEWAGNKWYSLEEMTTVMRTTEFENTGFGDIYVRSL